MKLNSLLVTIALATSAMAPLALPATAAAATAEDLHADARRALDNLEHDNRAADAVAHKARAVLVFPRIVKAGFVFGGAYGEGALMRGGHVVSYYNSVAGSWGLQAGVESYGYVVYLMTDKAEHYLEDSHGWEIGVGPSIVVVNKGVGENLSTSTLKDDAYAFIFNEKGLMADVSIEGTKISEIHPHH
jgi:lipid-binding SYLF domain-containing protein